MDELIPEAVLAAYVTRWPHLRRLADNVRPPRSSQRAARSFAQNVTRLVAPAGVGIQELRGLARVAEGEAYEAVAEGGSR